MVHTSSLHNYRGLGKLKGSTTHKTGGLSNLIERGGIKNNMDVLVGSVLLHSLDNLPRLDKDVVHSSLTALSNKWRCERRDDSYTRFKYNSWSYVMLIFLPISPIYPPYIFETKGAHVTETGWVGSVFLTRWICTDRSDQNGDKWWGFSPHLPSAGLTEHCLVHSVLFQALLHIRSGDFDLCIPIMPCFPQSHNNMVPSLVTAVGGYELK